MSNQLLTNIKAETKNVDDSLPSLSDLVLLEKLGKMGVIVKDKMEALIKNDGRFIRLAADSLETDIALRSQYGGLSIDSIMRLAADLKARSAGRREEIRLNNLLDKTIADDTANELAPKSPWGSGAGSA